MKANLIIVAAPSGAGKSSFVERICREEPRLVDTVTYTTRAIRRGESQGQPYHFVSKEDFQALIEKNFFVEWAFVHNNMYGTPLHQLEEAWAANKAVIMDVDVQGAATFRKKFPKTAAGIFILPPSLDELKRRIIKRDGQPPADLEVRLRNAEIELQKAPEFEYQVVNDDFERSFSDFKKIVEDLLSDQ